MKHIFTFFCFIFLSHYSFCQDLEIITDSIISASCHNKSDGNIYIRATGGSGSYEYGITLQGDVSALEYNTSRSEFFNIPAGGYDVYVRDSELNTEIINVVIEEPEELFTVATGFDGTTIAVFSSGGTPPYQYSIDGVNYQTSTNFTDLIPGIYTITVIDSNGCQDIDLVEVSIEADITSLQVSCNGDSDGSISINVTGGTAPYEYGITVAGDSLALEYEVNRNTFDNLPPGGYDVYVRDSELNTDLRFANIAEPSVLISTTTTTNSGTNPSGTIIAIATGGTPPYNYSLIDTSTNIITAVEFSGIFTNVASGQYTVLTEDANSCITENIVVVNTTPIDTSVEVTGNNLTASSNALSYQWINADTNEPIEGETNQAFTASESGNYRVLMTINDGGGTTTKTSNSKGQQAIITISSPTYTINVLSVEDKDLETLKLYPNPTQDNLTLPIKALNKDYVIYSILGKKVSSGKVTNRELSVVSLKEGFYFLTVEGMNTAKFFKQ